MSKKDIVTKMKKYCLIGQEGRTVFEATVLLWLLLNFSGVQDAFFKQTIQLRDLLKYVFRSKYIFETFVIPKSIHFFFLLLLVSLIANIVKNIRKKDTIHGLVVGTVFFLAYVLALVAVWPGFWSWDDIHMLKAVSEFVLSSWQHFLSEWFMMVSLMTIPIIPGVLIIQGFLASLIVGYCASKIGSTVHKGRCLIEGVILLVCLFPPLLEYLLSGFRMGLYSYLEFFLIIKLYMLYKNRIPMKINDYLSIYALAVLVASWRSEAIFYIILVPFFLLGLDRTIITKKRLLLLAIAIGGTTIAIGKMNLYLLGDDKYSITATMYPVVGLVRQADWVSDEAELRDIDAVLDVNLIRRENESVQTLFWNTDMVRQHSKDEYQKYLLAFVKLALKYPKIVISQAWKLYLSTSGLAFDANGKPTMHTPLIDTYSLFDLNRAQGKLWDTVDGVGKEQLNPDLRNRFLMIIGCREKDYIPSSGFYFLWNLFIPITLVMICFLCQVIRHKKNVAVLIFFTIARIPILFFASSVPCFMYYLSIYLMGYIWTIITVKEIFLENKSIYID